MTTAIQPSASTCGSNKLTSLPAVVQGKSLSAQSSVANDVIDWPYEAGFRVEGEQRIPLTLEVKGTIPKYACGTLYRNGPQNYKVDDIASGQPYEFQHWFDGQGQVHRFKLELDDEDSGQVTVKYNSRTTVDEVIEKIKKTGKLTDFTFGRKRDLCDSFFHKVSSFFTPMTKTDGKSSANVSVTLSVNMPGLPATDSHSAGISSLIAKTDASIYQKLNPETLEPMGYCHQSTLDPKLVGPLSASHAKVDPQTGDIFNYNLEIGRKSTYRIFRASASTGKVDILATFNGPSAYIHSLMLTSSTVILCVWNSHFKWAGTSLLWKRNMIDSIAPFDPKRRAQWFVIDRTQARRGVIATYNSPAFFCFHTINAYETASDDESGKVDIIADLAIYDDLSILHSYYYDALLQGSSPKKKHFKQNYPNSISKLARYRLPDVPIDAKSALPQEKSAILVSKAKSDQSPELPVINPRKSTTKHRYVYGVRSGQQSAYIDGLLKYDTSESSVIYWSEKGQTPGEPIFIVNPDGQGEDDGVLLSVVLDGYADTSYLLCLDAKTMKEVGRATAPAGVVVPHGFHGVHVPEQGKGFTSSGD